MADEPDTTVGDASGVEAGQRGRVDGSPYFLPSEHNLRKPVNSFLGRERRQTMRDEHGR